jgi:uncharacterized LabA/DUF88 family protein
VGADRAQARPLAHDAERHERQENPVSKNVAVFVDVANIFYAAKAAGVDIDYVTLLKAAIAGRDFVRAYAYTGLDPENENQRQFHAFLARSGYKVVSKDVRKYGDGKVKANLDIELVVDLMRTATNLDVAVVVSGDGDFAPAIRAVQQQGVRVEVISFRGNTSSDLIEVADSFTDIIQIAKVEKGSRSGRRVAAEGDLSMTAVPEKETEGTGRRRRGERPRRTAATARARPDRAAQPASALSNGGASGGLIVLPGERLARAGSEAGGEEPGAVEPVGPSAPPAAATADLASGEGDEAARRRRRRRGGRGRGRGRGVQPDLSVVEGGLESESETEEEPEYAAAPPRTPQTTFGSVWDSQLGVAPSGLPVEEQGTEPEGDEDEPAIPEYLLAERRERQNRRGRGGGRAAYQSAVERERFGRGAGGFAGRQRPPTRGMPARPGRPGAGPRERFTGERFAPRPSGGGDPWSEVPPELEEVLRAQLSSRAGRSGSERDDGRQAGIAGTPQAAGGEHGETVASEPVASEGTQAGREPRRPRRPAKPAGSAPSTRARQSGPAASADEREAAASSQAVAEGSGAEPEAPAGPAATPRRTTRRTGSRPSKRSGSRPGDVAPGEAPAGGEASAASEAVRSSEAAAPGEPGSSEPPARTTRRRTTRRSSASGPGPTED